MKTWGQYVLTVLSCVPCNALSVEVSGSSSLDRISKHQGTDEIFIGLLRFYS